MKQGNHGTLIYRNHYDANTNSRNHVHAHEMEGRSRHCLSFDDGDFSSDRRAVEWLRSRSLIRLQELEQEARQAQQPKEEQYDNEQPQLQTPQKEILEKESENALEHSTRAHAQEMEVNDKNILTDLTILEPSLPPHSESDSVPSTSLSPTLPLGDEDTHDDEFFTTFKIIKMDNNHDDGWPFPIETAPITTTTTTTTAAIRTKSTSGPVDLDDEVDDDDDEEEDEDHIDNDDDEKGDPDHPTNNNNNNNSSNMETILMPTTKTTAAGDAPRIITSPSSSQQQKGVVPKRKDNIVAANTSHADSSHDDDDKKNAAAATAKARYLQACRMNRSPKQKQKGPSNMSHSNEPNFLRQLLQPQLDEDQRTKSKMVWSPNQENNIQLLEKLQAKFLDVQDQACGASTTSARIRNHRRSQLPRAAASGDEEQESYNDYGDDDENDGHEVEHCDDDDDDVPNTTPKQKSSSSAFPTADSPAKLFHATKSWLLCTPRRQTERNGRRRNSDLQQRTTSTGSISSSESSSSPPISPLRATTFSMSNFPLVLICQSKQGIAASEVGSSSALPDDDMPDDVPPSSLILTPPLMEALRGFLPISQSENHFWLKYSLKRGDGGSLPILLQKIHASTYTLLCVETKDGRVFGSFTSSPWRQRASWYGSGEAFLWQVPLTQDKEKDRKKTNRHSTNSTTTTTNHEIKVYPFTGHDDLVQYCSAKALAVGGGTWEDPSLPRSPVRTDWTTGADHEGIDVDAARNPYSESEPGGIGLLLDADLLGGETNSCSTFANPRLSSSAEDDENKTTSELANEFEVENVEVWTLTPCTTLEAAESLEKRKLFIEEQAAAVTASRNHQ
jgi:hypothetical protein